ncbi:MAG: SDR family oxidoreductase [Acidimicrobiales bacterium]
MRVFVTGASGWIGSAVVEELVGAKHDVVGLARSGSSASVLESLGAEVCRGSLDDLEVLREVAEDSDGVIHLAFKHDIAFSGDFPGAATADRRAVEVFGETLAGSKRPLVIASGVFGLKPGQVSTERDGHDVSPETTLSAGPQARQATAEYVLSLAERDVRSSIVRLAPTNHGRGDNGFMATIVSIAREKGLSGYVGDGSQRWPAVHRLDSAKLFCLALERAPAGATLHGVAEEGVPIRDVAEVIGRHLNVPVESVSIADAPGHFTWLANFLATDSPCSSYLTQELMDWHPEEIGLLADLDEGHYFGH